MWQRLAPDPAQSLYGTKSMLDMPAIHVCVMCLLPAGERFHSCGGADQHAALHEPLQERAQGAVLHYHEDYCCTKGENDTLHRNIIPLSKTTMKLMLSERGIPLFIHYIGTPLSKLP